MNLINKYEEALESFKNKYSKTFGVVKIQAHEFGLETIVVLIDDIRYKEIHIPLTYFGFEVEKIGIYSLLQTYASIVYGVESDSSTTSKVGTDPIFYSCPKFQGSLTTNSSMTSFQKSLSNIEEMISDYENKRIESMNYSFVKIKEAMKYINARLPPLQKVNKK